MYKINPMIVVSLVLTLVVLVAVIYFSMLVPARSSLSIKMVSGEWPPYTGEYLQSNGIASAIVTHILDQMGYRAEYEFMPWPLGVELVASSQRNDNVRGIFPFMKTPEREKRFYFSDPIIKIDYAVFYHAKRNPLGANIRSTTDLRKHRILALQGYDYHPNIKLHLPDQPCRKKDTFDAFRHLAKPNPMVLLYSKPINHASTTHYFADKNQPTISSESIKVSLGKNEEYFLYYLQENTEKIDMTSLQSEDVLLVKGDIPNQVIRHLSTRTCLMDTMERAVETLLDSAKPAVLIEALEVGEQLLSERLPLLIPAMRKAPFSQQVEHAVMFSRNNPNNLALKDEFNRRLLDLKSNTSALEDIINSAKNRIDMVRAVSLAPFSKRELVAAYPYDANLRECNMTHRVFLPRGSKALIIEWHAVFLLSQQALDSPMVKVKLLNGPLASLDTQMCVDGRAVRLP